MLNFLVIFAFFADNLSSYLFPSKNYYTVRLTRQE